MLPINQYKAGVSKILERLPKAKVVELFNFAKFLRSQYSEKSTLWIDEGPLLLQQKSLSKIWDNPEEDVYEL